MKDMYAELTLLKLQYLLIQELCRNQGLDEFKCRKCQKFKGTEEEIVKHLENECGEVVIKCSCCDKETTSRQENEEHICKGRLNGTSGKKQQEIVKQAKPIEIAFIGPAIPLVKKVSPKVISKKRVKII